MFRSASLFIGPSFTVAVFTIFATSNVDSIVSIPHKIYSIQKFYKKLISLLNVPICTQGMQRTWWPEAGIIIVTGPYSYTDLRNPKNVSFDFHYKSWWWLVWLLVDTDFCNFHSQSISVWFTIINGVVIISISLRIIYILYSMASYCVLSCSLL